MKRAKIEVGIVAQKLANAQGEVLNLTGSDRDAYLYACSEFANAMQMPIGQVTSDLILKHLDN